MYRFYLFDHHGEPIAENWATQMDKFLVKQVGVDDSDRRILMPNNWVVSTPHCAKLHDRMRAYALRVGDPHLVEDENSMGSYQFTDFPPFIAEF